MKVLAIGSLLPIRLANVFTCPFVTIEHTPHCVVTWIICALNTYVTIVSPNSICIN